MPWLETELLVALIAAWNEQPSLAVVAHDGHTLQPLFGIYPNSPLYRDSIKSQMSADERSWMKWLERVPYRTLGFQAEFLRNANCPADLAPFGT
jgi:molybdopterin-guanine dinucleotide biosynthesis protein A